MRGATVAVLVVLALAACELVAASDGVGTFADRLRMFRSKDEEARDEGAKFPGGQGRILRPEITGKMTPEEYKKYMEKHGGIYVKPDHTTVSVNDVGDDEARDGSDIEARDGEAPSTGFEDGGGPDEGVDGGVMSPNPVTDDDALVSPARGVDGLGTGIDGGGAPETGIDKDDNTPEMDTEDNEVQVADGDDSVPAEKRRRRLVRDSAPTGDEPRRRYLRPNRRRPGTAARRRRTGPTESAQRGGGPAELVLEDSWEPMFGASGYVYKGVYGDTTVAIKIPKTQNLKAKQSGATDDPVLAEARDGVLDAAKKAFVDVAVEYIMECEFVRQLSESAENEPGAEHIISGVGPKCILVDSANIPVSGALSGSIPIARASLFDTYGAIIRDLRPSDPHSSLYEKAAIVALDLYKKRLLPVILLEFASHGALTQWTEPEHEKQLEALSERGNAYDGLRLAFSQLWKAVAYMATGNYEAGRMGFIHRDLKGPNVLVHADGDGRPVVKIADLGMGYLSGRSSNLDEMERAKRREDLQLQYEMEFCGTPGFFPPEVAMKIADATVDGFDFAARMEDGLGFGYDGLWEKDQVDNARTSLIADDDHPQARSARDSFTVGLMLAFVLYNRALNEGDAMGRFVDLAAMRREGLEGFHAASAHSASGCDDGQKYYHEKNVPWWAFIENKFGAESRIIAFLKEALVCNIRDRVPPLTLAERIHDTELNLNGCEESRDSDLCKELLEYTTNGEPEFPSMSESEVSYEEIEIIEETIYVSMSADGSVVVHSYSSDEPRKSQNGDDFMMRLARGETNDDRRESIGPDDDSAEESSDDTV